MTNDTVNDTVNAMKKARTESKRALRAIEALLEYYFDGHAMDRADASRSCLDALICALNVEIDDYEWHKKREAKYAQIHNVQNMPILDQF